MKNIFSKLMLVAVSVLIAGNIATAQEKIAPKLRLSYIKHMSGTSEIKARAYSKKGKEFEPCMGVTIGFYKDADEEQLYKKQDVDHMGETTVLLSEQDASAFRDSTGQYHFYAKIEKNTKYKSAEADLAVMSATIDAEFKQENDSTKVLKATLMVYDAASKKMIPGASMPLNCGVNGALCLLPVGKELNNTNDQGQIELSFPNDIPGDKDGNLTIVVKLEEDDNYGTVMFEKTVKWGVPLLHPDNPLASRSLIGSRNNAPWFMVVVISSILIAIWGYLCYIVFGLYKISKSGHAGS
jgi:hypothetical protein